MGVRQTEQLLPLLFLALFLVSGFLNPFLPLNNAMANPASGCFETFAMCRGDTFCFLLCLSGTTGLLLPGAIHISLSEG